VNYVVQDIQALLKEGYDRYFKVEGHCKSSEGYISIKERFPTYWDYGKNSTWEVEVFSYVFGPYRMHTFEGKTKEDALLEALKDVKKWMKETEWNLWESQSEEKA